MSALTTMGRPHVRIIHGSRFEDGYGIFSGLGISIASPDALTSVESIISRRVLPISVQTIRSRSIERGRIESLTTMNNLLVPVDLSDVTKYVVAAAAEIARPFRARIWLMHCLEDPSVDPDLDQCRFHPFPQDDLLEQEGAEYHYLQTLASNLRHEGLDVRLIFVRGAALDSILSAIDENRIDLTIMGSQGDNAVWEHEIGSVTEGVLTRSGRPVLVIPVESYRIGSDFTLNRRFGNEHFSK